MHARDRFIQALMDYGDRHTHATPYPTKLGHSGRGGLDYGPTAKYLDDFDKEHTHECSECGGSGRVMIPT